MPDTQQHLRPAWFCYALTTLPLRRQEVHTRMRLVVAPTRACTGRRLTFQRRLVTLWAWLMRFPDCGFLPQISHCCAMTAGILSGLRTEGSFYRIFLFSGNSIRNPTARTSPFCTPGLFRLCDTETYAVPSTIADRDHRPQVGQSESDDRHGDGH